MRDAGRCLFKTRTQHHKMVGGKNVGRPLDRGVVDVALRCRRVVLLQPRVDVGCGADFQFEPGAPAMVILRRRLRGLNSTVA